MVKDKTAEEIKQVMKENELAYFLKIRALWTKSEGGNEHTFPDTSS